MKGVTPFWLLSLAPLLAASPAPQDLSQYPPQQYSATQNVPQISPQQYPPAQDSPSFVPTFQGSPPQNTAPPNAPVPGPPSQSTPLRGPPSLSNPLQGFNPPQNPSPPNSPVSPPVQGGPYQIPPLQNPSSQSSPVQGSPLQGATSQGSPYTSGQLPPPTQAAPPPSGQCKAVPGTPQWPSQQDWAALNTVVKGRLLQPAPPAAACHRDQPTYNPQECSLISDEFRDSSFHVNHPTSNMWQNYNNYSCMPTEYGPCSTRGYPLYVVQAREASDVKAAVDFAREKNIRLNIKNTGHDFLGRSVQPYSLSIWTHFLKSTRWFDTSFSPKGCGFLINGPAVTVGSGSQWSELNNAARSHGVSLVGGASATVGVGGFLSNGGHGRLSARYGLGADMILEIELVTAQGEIITANECQNQDYFWAMRGGGGSTYGVALSYTLQALPTFPAARWSGTVSGWDELSYIHSQWPKIAMAGGGGYLSGYPGRAGGSVRVTVSLPNATSSELRNIIDPIMEGLGRRTSGTQSEDPNDEDEPRLPRAGTGGYGGYRGGGNRGGGNRGGGGSEDEDEPILPRAGRGENQDNGSDDDDDDDDDSNLVKRRSHTRGVYTDFATWADAEERSLHSRSERASQAPFPGMGSNKILASWLWSAQAVSQPQLGEALRRAFPDPSIQMLNDATMGVGTANPPYIRGGGNAVNPAFRTAIMRPAAEFQWAGTDYNTLAAKKQSSLRSVAALSMLEPQGGTYANEADPDTPNWQRAFWGSNYDRLLNIKTRVDPQGVFYCRSCVGSELFVDNAGVLCRK